MKKAVFVLAVGLLGRAPLSASFVATTSSATFESLVTITQTEDFGTLSDGQKISSGSTIDGLTYGSFVLQASSQLDITSLYASFPVSGLSLGANHTDIAAGDTFFFGGEGATITFASPVTAFGMFFNVSNSPTNTFGFTSSVGSVSTGSVTYDTLPSFVFAGIVSSTPFSSISFFSSFNVSATYNVPEFLLGTNSTPEPSTLAITMAGIALLALGALKRRYF